MKLLKVPFLLFVIMVILLAATFVGAADFDWTRELSVRAQADPSGFRAQLSTRFNIGDAQVKVVLGNVGSPADAYMVFRLGEMSSKPVDYVLNKYQSGKNKGWGVIAKSLGIKPGSKEFHALKQGSDIGGTNHKSNAGKKNKGKGKGKNK
jgi:hypothetical protein